LHFGIAKLVIVMIGATYSNCQGDKKSKL